MLFDLLLPRLHAAVPYSAAARIQPHHRSFLNRKPIHSTGLLSMAMVPLIAVAAVVQMAMMTGGYGDEEAREKLLKDKRLRVIVINAIASILCCLALWPSAQLHV